MARGRLSAWRSVIRSLISDELLVPLRKRIVLEFSWARGPRLESSRFERAFLGMLVPDLVSLFTPALKCQHYFVTYICRSIMYSWSLKRFLYEIQPSCLWFIDIESPRLRFDASKAWALHLIDNRGIIIWTLICKCLNLPQLGPGPGLNCG